MANEKEWLDFLDHPFNVEYMFECAGVCYEYALIQYKMYKDNGKATAVIRMGEKLLDVLRKHYSTTLDNEQKGGFDNIEYQYNELIFMTGRWGAQHLKQLVAYETKHTEIPEEYVHYLKLWATFRKEIKAYYGISTRRNIQEVDDEIINRHIVGRGTYGVLNNLSLKEPLTNFFGDKVSGNKIDKFIDGLTHKQEIALKTVFGGGFGEDQVKELRKHITDLDELRAFLLAMKDEIEKIKSKSEWGSGA